MELWMGEGKAWALLERSLLERQGWDVLPEVARTHRGKPYFPACPQIHFNLSHSGNLALWGVGSAPLGVDVEIVRPRREGLASYILSEEELTWFTGQGGGWELLYTLWTLKEARIKCTGQGLNQAPRTIQIPLLYPGQEGEQDGFHFRSYGGKGWRGAVCTVGEERLPLEIIQMTPSVSIS